MINFLQVLPIILYFSSFISVMYYLGAMQWIIFKIAWLMQISLRTSATESLVAAGKNFRFNQNETVHRNSNDLPKVNSYRYCCVVETY